MNINIRKGIKVFLLITIVISTLILILTVSEETWKYLKSIRPLYFLFTLLALLFYYYLDGVRVKYLAKGIGYNISVFTGIEVVVSGIFLAAVTPFQTGGFPVQVYYLKKNGIPYGEGTLILFMRGVLAIIFHVFALPFIFLTYSYLLKNSIVEWIIKYIMILYPLILIVSVLIYFLPEKFLSFLEKLDNGLFNRKKSEKSPIKRFSNFIEREIDYFKDGLKHYFNKRKTLLFVLLFLTFFSYIVFFSIAILILLGLGVKVEHPLAVANLQFLHNFLVYFMPTPGASGIAETVFAILFKNICPKDILGIYAIIWRFFTFTIGAFLGGILTLKIVQKTGKSIEQIIDESPKEENFEK
ncbi:MAG: flippase-like domain-containing protein [candidate division WOR-3 bacterium]